MNLRTPFIAERTKLRRCGCDRIVDRYASPAEGTAP